MHCGCPAVEHNRLAISQQSSRRSPNGLFGARCFQGPKVVGCFICPKQASHCPSVHSAECATALEGMQIASHGHFRATQHLCERPDLHFVTLLERLDNPAQACLTVHGPVLPCVSFNHTVTLCDTTQLVLSVDFSE